MNQEGTNSVDSCDVAGAAARIPVPTGALGTLIEQVRSFATTDPTPDPMELTRMWLLTTASGGGDPGDGPGDASGGSVYVTEVHASARLLHTADGRAYLTPIDRHLIGFGFAVPAIGLPSPNELDDWLKAQLAAHERGENPLSRSNKWRLQRLVRQLPRAARTPQRWAGFVLQNDVAYIPSTVFGVWMADGRRAAVRDLAESSERVELPPHASFWDCNPFSDFGLALCTA